MRRAEFNKSKKKNETIEIGDKSPHLSPIFIFQNQKNEF